MNNSKHSMWSNSKDQRGASLIESMVAIVVFSIGALGIVAMQTVSFVRSDDTRQRSVVIWKAQELVDKIRATKTIELPDGQIPLYLNALQASKAVIGNSNSRGNYTCPANAPTRCDDQLGTTAVSCSVQEMVDFDIWSVFCDPVSGLSGGGDDGDSLNRISDFDVAMVQSGAGATAEYNLYIEWFSRSTERVDSLAGAGKKVKVDLCGVEEEIDAQLGVYCLRFK